jgi:hypothetical protein
MDLISSGSLATELGWTENKVQGLCRAKGVPYITSTRAKTKVRSYTILDKSKFYEALMEMTLDGENVTSLEKQRRAANRKKEAAETSAGYEEDTGNTTKLPGKA